AAGGRALRLPGRGRRAAAAEGQPEALRGGVGAGPGGEGHGPAAARLPLLGGADPVTRPALRARQRPGGVSGTDPAKEVTGRPWGGVYGSSPFGRAMGNNYSSGPEKPLQTPIPGGTPPPRLPSLP